MAACLLLTRFLRDFLQCWFDELAFDVIHSNGQFIDLQRDERISEEERDDLT